MTQTQIIERLWPALVLCLALLFVATLAGDHLTWDEGIHFVSTRDQIEFARQALSGRGAPDFRAIQSDYAYYGIGTLAPIYFLSWLVDTQLLHGAHSFFNSFPLLLHASAFVSALAASRLAGRLVALETGAPALGEGAAAALLLIPSWIGYGFFDYKDMPVAAGVIAAVYFAAAFARAERGALLWFFASLLFLGGQKLAALPLALPACLYVVAHFPQRGPRATLAAAGYGAAFLALLYAITPPAWIEPIAYATTNLKYMAAHGYVDCTLTAGECIGRGPAEHPNLYSPLRYLGLWYGVQMPIGLLLLALAATGFYLQQAGTGVRHLLAASLAWPLFAIVWSQSTLYDGIRHTLFLAPLLVAFIAIAIPAGWWRRGAIALAAYGALLAAQIGLMAPYSYVWFNEPARYFASSANFVTDYWAYSLSELIRIALAKREPGELIVGVPHDLVAPSFEEDRMAADLDAVPPGAAYVLVSVAGGRRPMAPECVRLGGVERGQFLSPLRLELSFAARCVKPSS